MLEALESELRDAILAHFAGCGSATTAANVTALGQALASTTNGIPILSRPYILELLLASCTSSQNAKSSAFKLFDFYLTLPFRLAKGKSVNDSYDPALFCPPPSNGSLDSTGKFWADKRPNIPDKNLCLDSISAFPQFWHVSQEELRVIDYKLGNHRASAARQALPSSITPPGTPITPLFRSMFLRLRDFLCRLPPGVYAKQRSIDDASKRLDVLFSSLDALERLLMHDAVQALLKGGLANNSKDADELANLGFNVKTKKSQKQKKKQANFGYMTEREEQQLRDVETLKKAGFHIPGLESERQELKDQVNQELLYIYKSFVDTMQSKELVKYIRDRYKQQQASLTTSSSATIAKISQAKQAVTEDKVIPAAQVLPAAYPHIQPLKAARLFECDSKDLGLWQLYFSSKSVSQLRQLDNEMQGIVVKKVQQLSKGHFSRDNMKTLKGTDKGIPIYEAKCSRDIRIIYQVDLHVNAETSMESQILKIWAIATHAEVDDRLWSAISNELYKARSPEYRKRVIERSTIRKATGHGVEDCFDPISYARASSSTEPERDNKASQKKPMAEEDAIALHDLLALQKWMPYSRALINSTIAGVEDAKHAFLLSEHEQEVINHEGSAIVVGRSGTGKTSCALFRLIGIEETARLEGRVIRQAFMTKSPVLATKIKEYYHSLRQTLNLSTKASTEEAKNKDLDLWLTDDTDREKELPGKWSELQDRHFPLFLSFDHFSALLEADLGTGHLSADSHSAETRRLNSMLSGTAAVETGAELDIGSAEMQPKAGLSVSRADEWMHFIDLQGFLDVYWPHFDERLTKGLDPALCFSEFIGVIQGGESSLGEPAGCLSREAYLNLSLRAQATFAHAREQIYSLFLAYRAEKGVRRDWDAADRTHAILRAMPQLKVDLPKIEACYVDESQDNLLIDVALLSSIVSNPNGFLFAGDTAQSISTSTFRFEDLSAAFYRSEEREPLVVAGARPAIQPKTFNLLLNYRSHRGITNIGATLVEAIRSLFPDAIDTLERERGITEGTLPILFDGFSDSSDLHLESFLFAGSEACEFGAMQCIIVRDEAARTELRQVLGNDFGLILTIYESKGLEFNDVLLYRFFSDSQATESQWRVVLSLLNDPKLQVPKLDARKHSIILNELRNLYVAVTRARNRLWIFDTSAKAGPMKTLLAQRGLVQICRPTDPRPQMATSSSPSEWQATALKLFNQQLYSQSANAYSRAGKSHEANVALAYNQREKARNAHRAVKGSGKLYQVEFEKAAFQFEAAARESPSANNAEKLFRQAAQCYNQANKQLKSAACYESARDYTEAVRLYRLNGKYEHGLRILRGHAPPDYEWLKTADQASPDIQVDAKEATHMLQAARVHYVKQEQLKHAKDLFESSEEQLEWLDDFGFDTSTLDFLESLGKYAECADIHLAAGSLKDAARCLSLANMHSKAAECLYRLLLDLAPLGSNFATMADKTQVRSLLNQLEPLLNHLDQNSRMVTSVIRQATRDKPSFGDLLKDRSKFGEAEEIMLLDTALQFVPALESLSPGELSQIIAILDRFATLLRSICTKQTLPDGLLGYLGFVPISDAGKASVSSACPFFAQLPANLEAGTAGKAIVDVRSTGLPCSSFFSARLFKLLQSMAGQIAYLKPLNPPCVAYTASRRCNSGEECRRSHVSDKQLEILHARAGLLLQALPLSAHLGWVALRMSGYAYEYNECQRIRRSILELIGYCFYTSHHANGGLYYIYQNPEILNPSVKSLLYNEASDMLHKINRNLRSDVITTQLLLHTSLANIAAPHRFRSDFWHTRIARMVANHDNQPLVAVGNDPRLNFAFLVYVFHTEANLNRRVSVDVIEKFAVFVQSITEYNLPLELNVLLNMMETLFLMISVGGKQLGRGHGFDNQALPEHLARQAVHLLSQSRMQFYPNVAQGFSFVTSDLIISIMRQDSMFRLDGMRLYSSAKPAIVYRLLRSMALVGYNVTNFRIAGLLRNHTLQQYRRILDTIQANHQASQNIAGRPSIRFPEHVEALLYAKTWEDVVTAIRKGAPQPALDAVVELFVSGQSSKPIARGLRPVLSDSLENLVNRWHGLPEVKAVPRPAATTNASTATPDTSLVPAQVSKKQTLAASANNNAASIASDLALPDIAIPKSDEIPLAESVNNHDDGHLRASEMTEGDTSAAEIDYKSLAEEASNEGPTVAELASAKSIAIWWRRCRKRRQTRPKDFSPAFKEALALAASVPKTVQRRLDYMAMILVSHTEFKLAVEVLVKETEACKKKATSRLVDVNAEAAEIESLHERITSLASFKRRLIKYRKTSEDILPRGNLDLLETELKPIDTYITELFDTPSNGASATKKAQILQYLAKGRRLFDKTAPPIQTKKKEQRPALNTNEDDDMMDDDGDVSELDSPYGEDDLDAYLDNGQLEIEAVPEISPVPKSATIPSLTTSGNADKSARKSKPAKAKATESTAAKPADAKKKKNKKKSSSRKKADDKPVLEPMNNAEQQTEETPKKEDSDGIPELEPIIGEEEEEVEREAKEEEKEDDSDLPDLEPIYSEDDLD